MNMSDETMTLDVDEALSRFGGNKQVFVRLLLRFLELNAGVEQKLAEVLASTDCDGIAMFFHSIKGGAANLSAKRLAGQCAVLEKLARAGDIETVKAQARDFPSFFGELKIAVDSFSAS